MMKPNRTRRSRRGFTLIELLVVILILGILTMIALPAYLNTVLSTRQSSANANARALASAVQANAIHTGSYDTVVSDYATDMGGALPVNPCTGTASGYMITTTGVTATVTATAGTNCGSWTPTSFNVTL